MDHTLKLEIGDWVKGKSREGELIYGYVDHVDSVQGIVKVTVVSCDNGETIGKTVETLERWMKKLAVASLDEEQLRHLIDLALQMKDETWFMELTAILNSKKQKLVFKENASKNIYMFRNRLGKIN